MADNAHSLRISVTGAAGAFPAGALAGYALFADRSSPIKAPPPGFALFADAATPAAAASPGFALSADNEPAAAKAQLRRGPYRALAAALAIHLAILLIFIARLGPPERLGLEEGMPETLNVSVVSAADLKRFADPFRQDGNPSPARAEETTPSPEVAQKVPAPPQPAAQEAQEADASPPPPRATGKPSTPFDSSGFAAMASEQFAEQLTQAFKRSDARRQAAKRSASVSANVRLLRPGASHSGKSDEFERAVIWALGATKPMGNGKWGSTIVTFIVSAVGKVEGLRRLKSSGDNWLDQGALMAVRQARMPVPPSGLTAGDRTFNVEYISLPER